MGKKVVWIVNEYNYPDDSNTRQTNLCGLLNKYGYDCYIISGSAGHKTKENRIVGSDVVRYVETTEAKGFIINTPVYTNSYERVYASLLFQRRVWRNRNKLPKPDVIVSDFAGLFGNGFLKWKRRYGTTIVFDILDLWPEAFVAMGYISANSFIAKILYRMEHKSYREADGLIFSMQGGRDYIAGKGWSTESGGDVDLGKIKYLNNGVNLELVDQQSKFFQLDIPELKTDKFKVVYLGSISEFNGLDILVETARILTARGNDRVSIIIYGYGNQEERLKKKVEEYGLKNIKFMGRLAKEYAMSLLSQSDINCFTFKKTSILKYGVSPNKLFMYFASGKPVLSLIKPAYDLVEKRNAGITVDNDPVLGADAIEIFQQMKRDKYDELCANARKVAEDYDYKSLFKELIGSIQR